MPTPRSVECRSPKGRPLRPGSTTRREMTAGASVIWSRRLAGRIVRATCKTRPNIGPDAEKKMSCRHTSIRARHVAGPALRHVPLLRSGETAGHVPTGKRTVVRRKSACGQGRSPDRFGPIIRGSTAARDQVQLLRRRRPPRKYIGSGCPSPMSASLADPGAQCSDNRHMALSPGRVKNVGCATCVLHRLPRCVDSCARCAVAGTSSSVSRPKGSNW